MPILCNVVLITHCSHNHLPFLTQSFMKLRLKLQVRKWIARVIHLKVLFLLRWASIYLYKIWFSSIFLSISSNLVVMTTRSLLVTTRLMLLGFKILLVWNFIFFLILSLVETCDYSFKMRETKIKFVWIRKLEVWYLGS